MSTSHQRVILATLVAMALALALTGCDKSSLVWVDDGASYTTTSVADVIDSADISQVSDRPTTEATELRHNALATLREQGGSATTVANMLTSTFEPDTRGVPVYVERASLEGTNVVIVVEATGPKSGSLKLKRMWVLQEDGSVILATSR